MHILAVDDSYVRQNKHLGYGGFCLPETSVRSLDEALANVKDQHKIPRRVELKWSPPPDHFLRTRFKGVRHDLYRDVVQVLAAHGAQVLVAVHALDQCYGVRVHNWSIERASLWAAKQQLQFLAERFQDNVLAPVDDIGLIVSDRYGDRGGEDGLIRDFSFAMIIGTEYSSLDRICMPPLMADSKHTHLVQAADVVTGIVVATLGKSKYGIRLFEDVAKLFVRNPHASSRSFASMFSNEVIGYGLKLFPAGFGPVGLEAFAKLDAKYHANEKGLVDRSAPA